MKYPIFLFLLILSCSTTKPHPIPIPPTPTPEPVVYDTIHKKIYDTVYTQTINRDTVKGFVSVTDFGAVGDGHTDNANAFDLAAKYVIAHPQPLIIPIGSFYISRPWLLQNEGRYFTMHIIGVLSNKSSSDEYLSKIIYGGKSGYAIGIQYGRSIVIENLTILGQYTFPYSVTNYNIGTLHFSDWVVSSIEDTRENPYSAIVIDPEVNASGTRGGTSDVTIKNCSIKQWMVGICLTPNGETQNDEMVNILEDDIEACRIAIAVCQDQSKTINIKGLKVWSSVYTVLDGLTYGAGTGGGSIFCENWNIAGNCKELFNISTSRFPLSCKDIYSESLFRIGYVGNGTGTNFINTEIDFLSSPGMPEADYLIQGQANFIGGMLRYYDNDYGHRLMLATTGSVRFPFMFRDMVLNNPPIVIGLYGIPTNSWVQPKFENVQGYYTSMTSKDTLINIGGGTFKVDRTNWSAHYTSFGIGNIAKINDYILISPTSTTCDYYDKVGYCVTKVLGRVVSISGDDLFLRNVGINMYDSTKFDAIYIDRIK